MDSQIVQIIEMIVALVAAIVAYWQRTKKIDAENRTREVVGFFDPKDDTVTTPPIIVPSRSWKMDDATKSWVLAGHDSLNQVALLNQIEDAEVNEITHYYLTFQDRGGGYYEIEYGLMKGSGTQ